MDNISNKILFKKAYINNKKVQIKAVGKIIRLGSSNSKIKIKV
jgi:hypothetical protein